MPTPDPDPGVVRLMLDWAWAGVLALGGIIYKLLREEQRTLRTTQEQMITREEFREHERREERDREERRGAEGVLFDKIDQLDNKIDQKLTMIFERLIGGK